MPRRSRSDSLNVEMLQLLAQVGRLAPVQPLEPATISFESAPVDMLISA